MIQDSGNLRLEPTEGQRTPGSAGERLLVGLAALVLGGGALLAIIGSVVSEEEVAEADRSPRPTAAAGASPTPRPSRTPRPTPTPRVVAIEPGSPPDMAPEEPAFYGWIRAVTEVIVRGQPITDAPEVGVLAPGEVAYAQPAWGTELVGSDWLQLQDGQGGWIATTGDGDQLVELLGEPSYAGGPAVHALYATPGGYIVEGWQHSPHPTGQLFTATSPDGVRWQMTDTPLGPTRGPSLIARGPAGVLAMSPLYGRPSDSAWIWRVDDAMAWEPLGGLPDVYPQKLVGSDLGYLMAGYGPQGLELWFSSDGRTWHEQRDVGVGQSGWAEIAGTAMGFYAWDASVGPGVRGRAAAFSTDGRTWQPWQAIGDGPGGPLVY